MYRIIACRLTPLSRSRLIFVTALESPNYAVIVFRYHELAYLACCASELIPQLCFRHIVALVGQEMTSSKASTYRGQYNTTLGHISVPRTEFESVITVFEWPKSVPPLHPTADVTKYEDTH